MQNTNTCPGYETSFLPPPQTTHTVQYQQNTQNGSSGYSQLKIKEDDLLFGKLTHYLAHVTVSELVHTSYDVTDKTASVSRINDHKALTLLISPNLHRKGNYSQ